MKKQYLLSVILFLFFASPVFSQQFANRSFENWLQEQYVSLSHFMDSGDEGFPSISRETDAQHGNYSVKLQTSLVSNDTLYGFFINFDPDHFNGGDPYAQHVDSIVGYYKSGIVAQDTAWFLVQFKKIGVPVGSGLKAFTVLDNTNTWTKFKIDTNMPQGIVPDTLMIGAVSSNALNENPGLDGVSDGSWLQLDNLKFYSGGVEVTPVINNDFEDWNVRTIEKPEGFLTSLLFDITTNPLSVEKTTDATDGNFAVKLTNVLTSDNDTIVAGITNGSSIDWPPAGGLPLSVIPDSISYDIKLNRLVGGNEDAAWVGFIFKQNGNILHTSDRTYDSSTTGFIHENIIMNFNQYPQINQADSLVFFAWNAYIPGSTMIIDNIYLHSQSSAISDLTFERLIAFPNPANDILHLRFYALKPENVNIRIFDMKGRQLIHKKLSNIQGQKDLTIDVSQLPHGNYIYSVETEKEKKSFVFIKR